MIGAGEEGGCVDLKISRGISVLAELTNILVEELFLPGIELFFSFNFVCLILFFRRSFCTLRCSMFDHHEGLLYWHLTPR